MQKIILQDMPLLELGDIRRNKRFIQIVQNAIDNPGKSIPQQNSGWYDTKATYDFFKNESITLESIQEAIHGYGAMNVIDSSIETVLVVHDTSNISYNDLDAEGLGYLDNKEGRGILLHNSMAVSPYGVPLALLYQYMWTRDVEDLGKSKARKKTAFKDKETFKWLQGIQQTNALLGKTVKKVHVGDREADIYDLFFMEAEANSELLIRARQNRTTAEGAKVWDQIRELPAEVINLEIPVEGSKKKQTVRAEVRYKLTDIARPDSNPNGHESVSLTAIEIREIGNEKDGILWKLITTLKIETIEDVKVCIRWYTYRWLIERFHYVLKSGLKVEALQLKRAESLKKAIVTYSLAAIKIMQITYQSRNTPDISCELILLKHEWEALYMMINKTNQLPSSPPSLKQVVYWIGRLGGHLGRKSDGPPGVKSIWTGYKRLIDYAEIYTLLKTNIKFG